MDSAPGNDPEEKKDPHVLDESELISETEAADDSELEIEPEPIIEPAPEDEPEEEPPPLIPAAGVSRSLKTGVIIFTIITIGAFVFFATTLVKKVSSPISAPRVWGNELLGVAEKLRDAGLPIQAIEQYENFLSNRNLDLKVRAEVSLSLGSLYMDLGNCLEALPWLYQAEAAFPDAPWKEDLNARIDGCLHQVKNSG